ncbi:hypothetical protein [Mesorhizobium sp. CN2-181]|uniref:hypothetical protein n=1 Tax=Mesorhizobium yinganensis TaxID=3157707 RepID=UPI0032B72D57
MTDNVRKSAIDKLDYVRAALLDLKAICDAEQCAFLAHLLEMAYVECIDVLHRARTWSNERN